MYAQVKEYGKVGKRKQGVLAAAPTFSNKIEMLPTYCQGSSELAFVPLSGVLGQAKLPLLKCLGRLGV